MMLSSGRFRDDAASQCVQSSSAEAERQSSSAGAEQQCSSAPAVQQQCSSSAAEQQRSSAAEQWSNSAATSRAPGWQSGRALQRYGLSAPACIHCCLCRLCSERASMVDSHTFVSACVSVETRVCVCPWLRSLHVQVSKSLGVRHGVPVQQDRQSGIMVQESSDVENAAQQGGSTEYEGAGSQESRIEERNGTLLQNV
jgi:hypothetical protein